MLQSWEIDPSTGDYIIQNGVPVPSSSLDYPAYYRVKTPRLQWLYAPDTKYGSDFNTIQKNLTTKPPVLIENVAARALQPMVDDGRATNVDVTVTQLARSGVSLQLDITTAQAQTSTFTIPSLGVV